ncbi:DUF4007 family protein [Thiothrix litoralis]|uniref:DUF4007 family protein n=1 Tax=Thiothrix litoralis TaxID=2891210 RepID=A0ABX7WQN7_9GAMM|nr:DUF4007 family protein [Thiothrix litoralis]QTR45757.1 DUF4007 family protein [Thiothrix litoralis]
MKFNPKKVAFGRHETFSLRYSWLTKAYQEVVKDTGVFDADDATVRLGVGKNMVNAIRYWAQATQIIEKVEDGYKPTSLGHFIFDEKEGHDPYLEDEATIWLLHWQMASNPEVATCSYWLFNRYHKPEFTTAEATEALADFLKQQAGAKYSKNTLKNDTVVTLRMYSDVRPKAKQVSDEFLDAPFTALKLLSMLPDGKTHKVQIGEQEHLPVEIVAYAVASLFNATQQKSLAIEDLMYGKSDYPAPGAVFCLTESAFLYKLEQLKQRKNNAFDFRETAGVNQLYKVQDTTLDPMIYLQDYYAQRNFYGVAA